MHCGEEPRSGKDERQRDEGKEVRLAQRGSEQEMAGQAK